MTQTALWPCPKHESLYTFCKTHDTYKNFLKCWIIPNMCHMAALRRTKRYVLKQAHNRALPDWSRRHFQKVTVCENKYRDVMNVVHYLTMWQMFLVSTLLPAASTTASTTLLTQCISHLHPVPTRLLNTSTNPSMSHSPEVPNSCQKVASSLSFLSQCRSLEA